MPFIDSSQKFSVISGRLRNAYFSGLFFMRVINFFCFQLCVCVCVSFPFSNETEVTVLVVLPADTSFLAYNHASNSPCVVFYLWLVAPFNLIKAVKFFQTVTQSHVSILSHPLLTWLSKAKLIHHPWKRSAQWVSAGLPCTWRWTPSSGHCVPLLWSRLH